MRTILSLFAANEWILELLQNQSIQELEKEKGKEHMNIPDEQEVMMEGICFRYNGQDQRKDQRKHRTREWRDPWSWWDVLLHISDCCSDSRTCTSPLIPSEPHISPCTAELSLRRCATAPFSSSWPPELFPWTSRIRSPTASRTRRKCRCRSRNGGWTHSPGAPCCGTWTQRINQQFPERKQSGEVTCAWTSGLISR